MRHKPLRTAGVEAARSLDTNVETADTSVRATGLHEIPRVAGLEPFLEEEIQAEGSVFFA
jgi:hypothetical protein